MAPILKPAAILSLWAMSFSCFSQGAPESTSSFEKSDFLGRLKLDVPSSLGFFILGVSPDNIETPRKGSELALALLNGLDQQGNFQSGIALESNPYLWTLPDHVPLDSLLRDRKYRLLSGISVTFATSDGQETGDEATRVGMGVNFAYDFDDPLFSEALSDCLKEVDDRVIAEYLERRGNFTSDKDLSDLQAILNLKGEKESDACYSEHVHWNKTMFQTGIGFHNSDPNGEATTDVSGEGVWISYSVGVGQHYQVVFHGSASDDLLIAVDEELVPTDRLFAGVRVRSGSPRVRGFFEVGYADEDRSGDSDSFWQAGVGAEIEVAETLFFQLVLGDSFSASGDKKEFFSGQFKWAFSPTAGFSD